MSSRQTWFWAAAAAVLLTYVYFYHQHKDNTPQGPVRILSEVRAAAVQSVQVRPPGPSKLEIRAERTNAVWWLTEPLIYQGEGPRIETLLEAMEALTPAAFISPEELRSRPNADEEYGFSSPQAGSIILNQGSSRAQVLIGVRTAPGDQFFLQVVGREGVYVIDAELLNLIPRIANDWRERRLLDVAGLACDRLTVTNNTKVFELYRESQNSLWRMVRPFQARANHARVEELLEQLNAVQVQSFVSDAPGADLEAFGLHSPVLQLAFSRGTNLETLLQFGTTPTNSPELVYARRFGQDTVVTVPKEWIAPWRGSVYDFRDPHLVSLTRPVDAIEVQSDEPFLLQKEAAGWQIMPGGTKADPVLVEEFLSILSSLRIAQFVKDVVIDADLPAYGLAPPARAYVLKSFPGEARGSNDLAALGVLFGFGTNSEDRVFVRRTDESFVYAVTTNDFQRLPHAGWQLRDRTIWSFAESEVARLTITQSGRVRQLVRKGPHDWSLAPGSQGVINDLAIEANVKSLLACKPAMWVAVGEAARERFGFPQQDHKLTFEPVKGDPLTIELGGEGPSATYFAGMALDGEFRVFEIPWLLYRDISTYLVAP